MAIDVNKFGINPEYLEKKNGKPLKSPKEFNNLEDALKFAAKDDGDEAVLQIKDEKGHDKFIVVDIKKDIQSNELFEPNNLKFENAFISRHNKTVEIFSKPAQELDSSINGLEMEAELAETGKVPGISRGEAVNNPEKAVVYNQNLENIDEKYNEVIGKIKTKLADMPEGKDKEQFQQKLEKLEAHRELLKSEKINVYGENVKTKIWTAKAQLETAKELKPLAEVLVDLKEKELAAINEKLSEKKYTNAKPGSFFFKEGERLKTKAEGLEAEINFMKGPPAPGDDQALSFKETQLKNLHSDLDNAAPPAKGKIKERIKAAETEIEFLKTVQPWPAEKLKAKEEEIGGLEKELGGINGKKQEAATAYKDKTENLVSRLQKELASLKEDLAGLEAVKPPDQKAVKAKKVEIAGKEKDLYPLDNHLQDIALSENIENFKNASTPADKDKFADQAMDSLMKKMAKYYSPDGKVRNSTVRQMGDELLNSLQDEGLRKVLIHKYKLDSPENLDMLVLTMGAEAHGGLTDKNWLDSSPMTPEKKLRIAEDTFPIGAAAMNRCLSSIMVQAGAHYVSHGNDLKSFAAPSMETVLSIGKGTSSPLVAYAALKDTQISYRLGKMKDSDGKYSENYKVDEKNARAILNGDVNYILRNKEYRDPGTGKYHPNLSDPGAGKMTIRTKNNDNGTVTVNSGTIFNYVSPADVVPVMDMNRGWIQTPNQHKLGTYSPNSESFFRLPGVPGERDMKN
jgi:hypothetical protein